MTGLGQLSFIVAMFMLSSCIWNMFQPTFWWVAGLHGLLAGWNFRSTYKDVCRAKETIARFQCVVGLGAVELLIKERLEAEGGPTVTVESVELELIDDEEEDDEEDFDVPD